MSPEKTDLVVTSDIDPVEDALIEDIEEATEDIDELSEQLAVHSIISEERHDEILARVDECNQTIQTLSSQVTQGESPILTQLLNQMIELRTELATLKENTKSLMDSRSNRDRTPNPSSEVTPEPVIENPAEPNQEKSTVERSEENAEAKPRPRNRFI